MTEPNPDQPTNEIEDTARLRRLLLKRLLEVVADPQAKASALAVAARFLSEAGMAGSPLKPAAPLGPLPFELKKDTVPERQPRPQSALDNLPFPAPAEGQKSDQDEAWNPLDSPFKGN
jgi:hypothetical protein